MPRPAHPNKHIEEALKHAEENGWRIEKRTGKGHAWGRAFCGGAQRGACMFSVWSTPRSPENHARQILRQVDRCPHEA